MLGLFKEIGATWRSIVSVVLAYGGIVLLGLYNQHWLRLATDAARGVYNHIIDFIGQFSDLGSSLAMMGLEPGSVFVSMMTLFMRVVVLSLALWIFKGLGGLIFGRSKSSRY